MALDSTGHVRDCLAGVKAIVFSKNGLVLKESMSKLSLCQNRVRGCKVHFLTINGVSKKGPR